MFPPAILYALMDLRVMLMDSHLEGGPAQSSRKKKSRFSGIETGDFGHEAEAYNQPNQTKKNRKSR